MPIPTPNFDKAFVEAIRKNLDLVVSLLDTKEKGMMQKIKTFSSRFDFIENEIEEKIRKDKIFRAVFAKDPGKQKLHENIAAVFIKKIPLVKKFTQLSHGALQLISGAVMSKKDAKKIGATAQAKTIDFTWISCGFTIYASHKYTKSSGGAQDNQYKDLKDFISEANHSNLSKTIFLAIADGSYYSSKDSESGGTKLQRLKDLANRRNVFALTSEELEKFLQSLK